MKKISSSGQIVLITLIVLSIILTLVAGLFLRVTNFVRFGSSFVSREQAIYLAEAGIENALFKLNQPSSTYTGETNTLLGVGAFTVNVPDTGQSTRTITSTGCRSEEHTSELQSQFHLIC